MAYKCIVDRTEFDRQCAETACAFPVSDRFDALAEPLTVGGRKIRNRIVYQAMEGCDGTADGRPGELTVRRYSRFAAAAPGIVWVEATAIVPEGRANPRQLYLNADTADSFKALAETIRRTAAAKGGEPLVFLQLTHSGRYSKPNGYPEPMAARHNARFDAAVPLSDERIVSDEYLDRLIDIYAEKAALACSCGFDGAEIKCCHGYLLSELLGAYDRPGKYGGSLENRSRMLREAVRAAMAATKRPFIITTRMNAYDGFEYPFGFGTRPGEGLTPYWDEAAEILRSLHADGVDIVNITMGNPYVNPHVNRPFTVGTYEPPEHPMKSAHRLLEGTARLKEMCPGMTFVSSGISYLGAMAPYVAAGYVEAGRLDLIGFGRLTLAYPSVASDILHGTFSAGNICLACSKCSRMMRAGGMPGCAVRDGIYKEEYRNMMTEAKRA